MNEVGNSRYRSFKSISNFSKNHVRFFKIFNPLCTHILSWHEQPFFEVADVLILKPCEIDALMEEIEGAHGIKASRDERIQKAELRKRISRSPA